MQVSSTMICPVGQSCGLRITYNMLFSLLNFSSSNAWFAGSTKEKHMKMKVVVLLFLEEMPRT